MLFSSKMFPPWWLLNLTCVHLLALQCPTFLFCAGNMKRAAHSMTLRAALVQSISRSVYEVSLYSDDLVPLIHATVNKQLLATRYHIILILALAF